jgi:hypothetical protein
VVVVVAVELLPVAPAGAVPRVPSPRPAPGLTPPKSPPSPDVPVETVIAGAAAEVVVALSGFGAKRPSPVVPGAVTVVGVDPAPVEGAAVVPVPVVVIPGGFRPPKILKPLVIPVVGAAPVGFVSNRPQAGAAVVGVAVEIAALMVKRALRGTQDKAEIAHQSLPQASAH